MRSTQQLIDEWRDRLGPVPDSANDFVCNYCLGPAGSGYAQCASCLELFLASEMPESLYNAVVPMTSALNPSPWYSALVNYKGFHRSNGAVLASLTHHFLVAHAASIERKLGGPPSMISIVPSKRVAFKDQPLGIALGWVEPIRRQLQQTLIYDTSKPVPRKEYSPGAFRPAEVDLTGKRIALIEDTWVTGATAMSAAGALLRYGVQSVAVFPIARVLNDHYWAEDHPYRAAMRQRYRENDPLAWPR